MSKQDTHFFNVFSLVIGLLVAIAILLFALARTSRATPRTGRCSAKPTTARP